MEHRNSWRLVPVLSALFLVFLHLSCAAKSDQAPVMRGAMTPKQADGDQAPAPERGFAPQGIQIDYTAAHAVNLYEGKPHTLLVVVYQLDSINGFKDLTKDEDGMNKLLQVEQFDASVVGMDKFIVEPGESKTITLDRVEKAKWVGVVAGYYRLSEQAASRFYEIPVVVEKKGLYGFRKTASRLGLMSIHLIFGPYTIQSANGNT